VLLLLLLLLLLQVQLRWPWLAAQLLAPITQLRHLQAEGTDLHTP
jgi:hypothetical protein